MILEPQAPGGELLKEGLVVRGDHEAPALADPCPSELEEPVAELGHRLELPRRIDVQQRERQPAGVERLLRQSQTCRLR